MPRNAWLFEDLSRFRPFLKSQTLRSSLVFLFASKRFSRLCLSLSTVIAQNILTASLSYRWHTMATCKQPLLNFFEALLFFYSLRQKYLGHFSQTLFFPFLCSISSLSKLFIAVRSPNLVHQHWGDKETPKCPNHFDWDCSFLIAGKGNQDKGNDHER